MTSPKQYDITEEKDFLLVNRTSSPEVFVEGVSQVMMGFPLTKIVLHSVVEPKDGTDKEIRRVVQTLSMPTLAALELAKIVLSLCSQSESQLCSMAEVEFSGKLKLLLSGVEPDPSAVRSIER